MSSRKICAKIISTALIHIRLVNKKDVLDEGCGEEGKREALLCSSLEI